ncbi:MAG: amidase [Mizugakiibacter sp.]|uniref:amidase n=1 Tax=Mizugakiibacter sp. TaxID=1972610 RepID=UPI0031C326ED|nr:amidase [Xanthomonadaceae bacterium]
MVGNRPHVAFAVSCAIACACAVAAPPQDPPGIETLQQQMAAGALDARALTREARARIDALDRSGPALHAVIELNPDADAIAARLDAERRHGRLRGPLHGIPVLLKDNIDTGDRMQTTAGSLALVGAPAPRDAGVAARLRAAGAVILGKTNLSEWSNFRSDRSTSGWSGRGGLTRNPYALDRNACGSSSGSAVAVAAGYVPAAVGTETDGSIVCPAAVNGIVGIKPTVGLVSRAGIVPISRSQDTAGAMARSVQEAALLLSAIAGSDPRDPSTAEADAHATDYTRFLDAGALRGKRIGVVRALAGADPRVGEVLERSIAALRAAGAEVVDDVELPHLDALGKAEMTLLRYEFKADLGAYLATRRGVPVRSIADLVEWNRAHADRELQWFGQDRLEDALKRGSLADPAYRDALEKARRMAGPEGIDAALAAHRLDALMAPTVGPAWTTDLVNGDHVDGGSSTPAAVAGYPDITVPAGLVHGLPVGISFFAGKWSEPRLLGIAYAFEQATRARRAPTLAAHVEGDPAAGTP